MRKARSRSSIVNGSTPSSKGAGRRALLEMSDEQLKDIGLSRADVHFEADRPFWR